jgi:RNA polymerase sigma factor (sigma-70 family)
VEAVADLGARAVRTSRFKALGYSPGAMADDVEVLSRGEVLERVSARILAFARARLSPADAEDLAQEAMLLLTTKYADVVAPEELVALGLRIVALKRAALWRKATRRREKGETTLTQGEGGDFDPLEKIEGQAPDPERVTIGRQRLALLAEATARLDGRCREILRRKLEGASFVEIAAELGRPVNTVYSWDWRCHKRLRALLGERWGFVSGQEER